jgi:hypothetical protein
MNDDNDEDEYTNPNPPLLSVLYGTIYSSLLHPPLCFSLIILNIGNSPFADPHMDQVAICKNIVRGECFFEFEWLDRYGIVYFQKSPVDR